MRAIICLILTALPAHAWEFSPTPVCTLSHEDQLRITFDGFDYAIHLTRPDGWVGDGLFSIRFNGTAPLTISTDRHSIDGPVLTVKDRGFGNVLNGLEFNATATAQLGDTAITVDLSDAAASVRAFRACPADVAV